MNKIFLVLGFMLASVFVIAEEPSALADWNPAHSGNYTEGRGGKGVDFVIIHVVQGSYNGCISWFKNPSAKVSAHYVVSNGGAITQMVREADTAWHAGNWSYNQRSIGIEHEGYVTNPSFPDAMYRKSAALVREICNRHGIPKDRSHIIGHVEVPGATHTDPGKNWDWGTFMSYVRGNSLDEADNKAPAPVDTEDEYKLKVTDVKMGVEKLQKSIFLKENQKFHSVVKQSDMLDVSGVAIKDLEQALSFDCNHGFLGDCEEKVHVSFVNEGKAGNFDLIYVYNRHDVEVWFRSAGGEWQKVANGTLNVFQSYKFSRN